MNGLRTWQAADRFTVIQFKSIHEALFDEPVVASEDNLSRAQRYVGNLHATGGAITPGGRLRYVAVAGIKTGAT